MYRLPYLHVCTDYVPHAVHSAGANLAGLNIPGIPTPFLANTTNINLGLLRTGGTCSFGKWNGTLKFDGHTVAVRDLIGWAEEFSHRW